MCMLLFACMHEFGQYSDFSCAHFIPQISVKQIVIDMVGYITL